MNIEAKLRSWNKKTISISELESLLHTGSDAELCNLASDAVSAGLLAPVKASGTNGNKAYPVYLKYRITLKDDHTEALSEIEMLHPAMIKTCYLQSKPEMYVKYRKQLKQLSAYLFKRSTSVPVSKKERSFEIFEEEKKLDDHSFTALLERLGLGADFLGYYETPEYCFNDFIPERKNYMTLLICENKDIWFNIRRRMFEDGAREIFGSNIDGVVYGCGNRISEVGALSEYTRFMGSDFIKYLYWGDIDRAGLNIYLSLLKNNPELNINLFVPAYERMIQLADKHVIPDSSDHSERMGDYESIYSLFAEEYREPLAVFIDNNKRVPQEIISYKTLLEAMR